MSRGILVSPLSWALHINIMDSTLHYMRTAPSLLLPLFRSANQERILSSVFFAENRKTIQDLSLDLGIPYPTVHREVGRLLEAGLIKEKKVGNYRFIQPNETSPYFKSLRELLEISSGPVPLLRNAFGGIQGVEKVFIFGSWAHRALGSRGTAPEDIDVLVVGQPDIRKVYAACTSVGKQLGWSVNPTTMSNEEWQAETPFLKNVRKGGVINVIGSSDLNVSA